MRRPTVLLLTVLAALGSWFFVRDLPRPGQSAESPWQSPYMEQPVSHVQPGVVARRPGETIRVATFNLQVFGATKADKPHVMEVLAGILSRFDVVALQEIRSNLDDVVPRLVEQINRSGRHYDYVIGPRLGRTNNNEQYAYLFDRNAVEIDRYQLYTVDDPDDLLHREPLVAWFRCVGPAVGDAFTFTLVNVHLDPDEVQRELSVLDDVYRAVKSDGRQEDDVIVLGDFNADGATLGQIQHIAGMVAAIQGIPTNTRGTAQYDNLVFQRTTTDEFTGRVGVFDFMRQFNFTMNEALEISDHMPAWAEFSVFEGGSPGRIATRSSEDGSTQGLIQSPQLSR